MSPDGTSVREPRSQQALLLTLIQKQLTRGFLRSQTYPPPLTPLKFKIWNKENLPVANKKRDLGRDNYAENTLHGCNLRITRGNPGEVLNYKHQPTQRARTSFTARCITDGQGAPVRRMWEIDTTALRNRQCSIWTLQLQRNIWILDNLVGPPKEEAFIRMKRHLDVTTNILQLRTYFEPQYLWNIVSQKQKYKVSQEGIKVVQPMT